MCSPVWEVQCQRLSKDGFPPGRSGRVGGSADRGENDDEGEARTDDVDTSRGTGDLEVLAVDAELVLEAVEEVVPALALVGECGRGVDLVERRSEGEGRLVGHGVQLLEGSVRVRVARVGEKRTSEHKASSGGAMTAAGRGPATDLRFTVSAPTGPLAVQSSTARRPDGTRK